MVFTRASTVYLKKKTKKSIFVAKETSIDCLDILSYKNES